MDGSYSQALDEQASLLHWADSEPGKRWFEALDEIAAIHHKPEFPGQKISMRAHILSGAWRGETYYCGAPICDLIAGAAENMPNWTLTPDTMLTPYGFCWFAKAMPMPAVPEASQPSDLMVINNIVGISWATAYWIEQGDPPTHMILLSGTPQPPSGKDVVYFTLYGPNRLRSAGVPMTVVAWPINASRTEATALAGQAIGERYTFKLNLVASLLAFLQQQILTVRRERANRATRKRASKHFLDDRDIRVIVLRRKHPQDRPHQEHDAVDWSYQWLVRGHWRQQWMPGTQRHEARWIATYVKGPEDKPLKPPKETVFAVVR